MFSSISSKVFFILPHACLSKCSARRAMLLSFISKSSKFATIFRHCSMLRLFSSDDFFFLCPFFFSSLSHFLLRLLAPFFSFFIIFVGKYSGSSGFSFLIFASGISSESRYFASSLSLLGRKDEELSDTHSGSTLDFRKFLGGVIDASSSSLLTAKLCEIKSFSPFMRPKIVDCKLAALMFFSLMSKFKHTAFSKFRYVGAELISTLHRNTSPIFSRIFRRF